MRRFKVPKLPIVLVILWSFLGLGIWSFFAGIPGIFAKNFELILGEGFLWYLADTISRGEPLYREMTLTQYQAVPYPPVYLLVTGWLTSIFESSLLIGRLTTLLCSLGIVVFVGLITKKVTGNTWVACISAALVFSLQVWRFLAPIYRMDTMAAFFALAGMYVFVRFEEYRFRYYLLALPLFILAVFTKMQFFVAPLAICVYLVVRYRLWKQALQYGFAYLGLFFGVLLIGGLLTNWQMVIQTCFYILYGSGLVGQVFINGMKSVIFYHYPIYLLVFGYLGYKVYKREKVLVLDIYFLLGSFFMLLTIGKPGASFHYSLESLAVGCILVGVILSRVFNVLERGRLPRLYSLASGAIIVLIVLQSLGFPLGQGYYVYKYYPTTERGVKETVEYLNNSDKPILSHGHSFPLLAREDLVWDPWEPAIIFISRLHERELFGWDQSEWIRRLETGYYGIVVLIYDLEVAWSYPEGTNQYRIARQRLSPEIAKTMLDNYELIHRTELLGTASNRFRAYVYKYSDDLEYGIEVVRVQEGQSWVLRDVKITGYVGNPEGYLLDYGDKVIMKEPGKLQVQIEPGRWRLASRLNPSQVVSRSQ